MMSKQQLRQTMRRLKSQCHADSTAVIARLEQNEHFAAAHTLFIYYALADEVDTSGLIERLAQQGKTVLLPRVTGPDTMELRRYEGPTSLKAGAFGIMEPTGKLFERYEAIDVAVVPGMAFDASGHRLGRGRGYYDRLLPLLTKAYRIGLCFPFQLVNHVPTSANDVDMHCVQC